MVVPRMAVAGADLNNIVLRPMGSVGLPDAIPDLLSEMHDEGLAWLFLDGVNKHFSDKYHPDNKRDVAMVLGELAQMAAENQITMVGSLHTNRGGGMTARERYAHSQEFRRSLRSAVLLGEVKGAPRGNRAIVHDFSNYTRLSPSLNATISAVALEIGDKPTEQPMLKVGEEVDVEAADLFLKEADREGAIKDAKEEHGLKGQCTLNIRGHWERMGRPREASRSDFAVVTKQFSDKVVQRARRSLGIESRDERDPDSNAIIGYIWVFPEEV